MKASSYLFISTLFMMLLGVGLQAESEFKRFQPLDQSKRWEDVDKEELSAARGYLPVPNTVSMTQNASTKIITPSFLGTTTTSLCSCGVHQLSKAIEYTTTSLTGCPMIRIIGSGVTFDMSHNCACFVRSSACSAAIPGSHGVGIEVGYSPNLLGSNLQPTSVVIENGILCDWDVAILIHHGVRDVILRNLVLSNNVIPIIVQSKDDGSGNVAVEVTNIQLENVSILGGVNYGSSGGAQLSCLQWISSYLTNGTAQQGTGPLASSTVATTCGYNQTAIMPKEDNPVADAIAVQTIAGAGDYVYAGIYMYGVSNLSLKNVSSSDIGYDGATIETTATHNLWFRKCHEIYLEEVEATKSRSQNITVAAYFDGCDVISVEKAQFSNNYTTYQGQTFPMLKVYEGSWAAGVVLKDCNTVNMSDVVVSKTSGYNNVWGVRTILSPASTTNSSSAFNFKNIWADYLIGNNVYGFDFGDLFHKDATVITPVLLSAGKIHKLDMKNVSVSGCLGLAGAPIATAFKGIYLGDNSSAINIDEVYIDSNEIANTASVHSGIEFGSSATASVNSGISNLACNNVSMVRNGELVTTALGRFVAFRGVVGTGASIFKDIVVSNALIENAAGYGVEIMDAAGVFTNGTVNNISLKNSAFDNSYASLSLGAVNSANLINSTFSNNANLGISVALAAVNVIIDDCEINKNASGGISFGAAVNDLQVIKSSMNQNATGAGLAIVGAAAGVNLSKSLFIANATNGLLFSSSIDGLNIKESVFTNNTSSGLNTVGAASGIVMLNSSFDSNATNNLLFSGSLTGLKAEGCSFDKNTTFGGLTVTGISKGIDLKKCTFNGNTTSGITLTGVASGLSADQCTFNGNTTSGITTAAAADGFKISNSSFDGNTTSGMIVTGAAAAFDVSGSSFGYNTINGMLYSSTINGLKIDKCSFDGNTASGITAVGVASAINANASSFSGNGVNGLNLFSGASVNGLTMLDCVVDANIAEGVKVNTLNGAELGRCSFDRNTIGISSVNLNGLKMIDCTVNKNTTTGLVASNAVSGIDLQKSSFNSNVGAGINFNITTGLTVVDSSVNQNLSAGLSIAGVLQGVDLKNSSFIGNGTDGIVCISQVTGLSISDCLADGNNNNGLLMNAASRGVNLTKSSFSGNSSNGIVATTTLTDLVIDHSNLGGNAINGLNVFISGNGWTLKNSTFNYNGYYGIACPTLSSIFMKDCQSNNNLSGNGFDVSTAGTCLVFQDSEFNGNRSATAASGLHVVAGNSISLKNVHANGNVSTGAAAYGLYFATSAHNIELINVMANENDATATAGQIAYGIEIDNATGVFGDGIVANSNKGYQGAGTVGAGAYGLYFKTGLASCFMKGVQACYNTSGIVAYGLWMDSPSGVDIDGLDVSANASVGTVTPNFYQVAGAYLNGGSSVHIANLHANSNIEADYDPAQLYTDSTRSILESVINTTNQIAHHFPVRNQAGAYGVFINGTADVTIEGGSASKNDGVRAYGIHARSANNLFVKDVDASQNAAHGGVWFNPSPFAGLTNTALAIPADQIACLFGYTVDTKVNLVNAYQMLLIGLGQQKSTAAAQDLCTGTSVSGAASEQLVASMYRLIWSILAQYRQFSTALGIGLLNCEFPTVESCRTLGNISDLDSAGGIAVYGGLGGASCTSATFGQCYCGNEGASLLKNVVGNNECYQVSERGGQGTYAINGSINFAAWLPLYTFIGLDSYLTRTGANTYTAGAIASPIAATSNGYINPVPSITTSDIQTQTLTTPSATFTWSVNPRTLWVGFTATPTILYDFVAPLPIATGILVECQRDCYVGENNTYGMKANVGFGAGILADGAMSTMFIDNKATGNAADALGYAFGLADFELTTPNIWYKNWMYANRIDVFLNSSYLIVFDQSLVSGQSLPLVTIYPGSIDTLANLLPYDNIVVFFVNNRQISACVNEAMAAFWASAAPVVLAP